MPEEKNTMLNHNEWKLAAPGAGVIVYNRTEQFFRAWLSMRTNNVGAGLGITGGGFVECKEVDAMKVGSVIQTVDEAWRECHEENAGFENVISKDAFMARANPTSLVHARADDINRVHCANMYALRVTDEEWLKIGALPAGLDAKGRPEREDDLREVMVSWNGPIDMRRPERFVTMQKPDGERVWIDDFNYPHEFHAVASIAWNIQNPREW